MQPPVFFKIEQKCNRICDKCKYMQKGRAIARPFYAYFPDSSTCLRSILIAGTGRGSCR